MRRGQSGAISEQGTSKNHLAAGDVVVLHTLEIPLATANREHRQTLGPTENEPLAISLSALNLQGFLTSVFVESCRAQ